MTSIALPESRVTFEQLVCTLCARISVTKTLVSGINFLSCRFPQYRNQRWTRREICAASIFDCLDWNVTRIVCGDVPSLTNELHHISFPLYAKIYKQWCTADANREKSAFGLKKRKEKREKKKNKERNYGKRDSDPDPGPDHESTFYDALCCEISVSRYITSFVGSSTCSSIVFFFVKLLANTFHAVKEETPTEEGVNISQ